MICENSRKALLRAARSTVARNLGITVSIPEKPDDKMMDRKFGVFVTITGKRQLRGCIGYIIGIAPLWDAVKKMAYEAAFSDPRFIPLEKYEMKELVFEISVLTPLEGPVSHEENMEGYGLFIKNGIRSGLLLPQVADKYQWDSIEFLRNTCMKAGLHPECYLDQDTEIYRFKAEVFGEGGKNE